MQYYFLIFYIIFFEFVFSQTKTAKEIMQSVSKKYSEISNLKCEFTQTTILSKIKKTQKIDGTLSLKKVNKFLIQYEHQTISCDGKTVWTYVKQNNQVLIDNYKDDKSSMSIDKIILNNFESFFSTFIKEEKIDEKNFNVIKLTPKDDKSTIQNLKVWIKDDIIKKVETVDKKQNSTTYFIKEIKFNQNINDDLFNFIPPKETEIIDLR